jgi:hypothetical protein
MLGTIWGRYYLVERKLKRIQAGEALRGNNGRLL